MKLFLNVLLWLALALAGAAPAFAGTDSTAQGLAIIATQPATVNNALRQEQYNSMPSGLGWNLAWKPKALNTPGLYGFIADPVSPYVDVGATPTQIFNAYSNAFTAPANTYYVDPGGTSSTCAGPGTSACSACVTAVLLANASAQPATIFINNNGTYWRNGSCVYGQSSGFGPTVDTAFVFTNGRSNMTTADKITTWALSGGATTVYQASLANADRVVDMVNLNRYGNYTNFVNLPVAASAAAEIAEMQTTCNSWGIYSSIIYVNRCDGQPVTYLNTRVYRGGTPNFVVAAGVNVLVTGQYAGDGVDFEGGFTGVFFAYNNADPGADHVAICSSCSFKYGGGFGPNVPTNDVNTVGFGANSFRGLTACFNCRSDENATDAYNEHFSLQTTGQPYMMVINSSSQGTGFNNSSQNCLTHHEFSIAFWGGVTCEASRGGEVRSIGNSKALLVADNIKQDFGDLSSNGVGVIGIEPPVAIQVDNNAVFWLDSVRCIMPGATLCLYASATTSSINVRNSLTQRQPNAGAGTFGAW